MVPIRQAAQDRAELFGVAVQAGYETRPQPVGLGLQGRLGLRDYHQDVAVQAEMGQRHDAVQVGLAGEDQGQDQVGFAGTGQAAVQAGDGVVDFARAVGGRVEQQPAHGMDRWQVGGKIAEHVHWALPLC